MEPTDINGGRFYARPLHNDDRIDDTPALAMATSAFTPLSVAETRQSWLNDTMYTWAVCEQTNIDMIALAVLHLNTDGAHVLDIVPVGDPYRLLPNDPVLERKTVQDAITEIREPITRWATAHNISLVK
ncbi:Uncharacterised protein [Corynebacterium kutscheri]|uniref:Uncharacterized protein n=1 Tax=Corynebacterium kutscheri TaxID=35755 RepID=A0A0F6QZE6_9CORY|nr:hypothetical protein [Corynebacterium kutscheri]AKE40675.1 hypothetical protein UL82_02250 [Corynebacterium kutscheri]VEH04729.1 Uncharacterised protein [Corynebacterium kutscheri]VEH11072.1 Uncharacterised protein [Corynebacterium kutscheri]VEH80450.1 Uncharacterised protein [Corynebacterium kutscheri]